MVVVVPATEGSTDAPAQLTTRFWLLWLLSKVPEEEDDEVGCDPGMGCCVYCCCCCCCGCGCCCCCGGGTDSTGWYEGNDDSNDPYPSPDPPAVALEYIPVACAEVGGTFCAYGF